jgi:predicted O-methyltransferase YrrM
MDNLLRLYRECSLTEDEILGDFLHPQDVGAYFLRHRTYVFYYVVGLHFQPESILELGTRYGYSLKAMVEGSKKARRLFSVDGELDDPGSCAYTSAKFALLRPEIDFRSLKANLRDLTTLREFVNAPADLAHVDADHSAHGTYQDCHLAYEMVRPGGVMVIDDVKPGDARIGADRFIREVGCRCEYYDTYRGNYVLTELKQGK